VTGEAALFGNIACPFGNVHVTLIAGYAKLQIGIMGEGETFMLDYFNRHAVTGKASGRCLTFNSSFEMADIADLLSNCNMFPLHDLGVAARAHEFQTAAQLPQMVPVVEDD